jgi:hypothetical protein
LHGTPKNTLVRVFLPLRAFTNTRNLSPTRALLKKQAAETLAKPLLFFLPRSDFDGNLLAKVTCVVSEQ